MMRLCYRLFFSSLVLIPSAAFSQNVVDTVFHNNLDDFVFEKKRAGNLKLSGPENSFTLNQTELFKAACCNLGESFTTNPSVDVNYSDPATGARQIKLLGLSGSYVQLLTENMPAFRGLAIPYALRYVPGPWMKSISVSKGASSVKNGYESLTGQINIEYLKPDDEPGVSLNAFLDSDLRVEGNADGSIKITDKLSTVLMAHFEDRTRMHDGNHDGFTDMPDIRQVNFQNRWKYRSERYIFHGGIGYLNEKSRAGQLHSHSSNPYTISLLTNRGEAYMKHAFILDPERGSNIAIQANWNLHDLDASYGIKAYDSRENDGSAQAMFETDLNDRHSLSAGLSMNHTSIRQYLLMPVLSSEMILSNGERSDRAFKEKENVVGAYAQYTWKPYEGLTAMAGVRMDHSSLYGWFATPRLNVRWSPTETLNLRASIGQGRRTVFGWAEFNYLMASSRSLVVENLNQELAWNYGFNADMSVPIGDQTLRLNGEYYFTDFKRQVIADYDSDPHSLTIGNLKGKSYSHTIQFDATLETSFGLEVTAAWRRNIVRTTYAGILMEKPLQPSSKSLLAVSYSTPMDIWQFDLTLQLNGGGRMPSPYKLADGSWSWPERFRSFPQLNFQVTRWFRHFSIYAGGENLTNFKQKNPIIQSGDPWGPDFDSTMIWGPVQGAMGYVGIRFNFGKL